MNQKKLFRYFAEERELLSDLKTKRALHQRTLEDLLNHPNADKIPAFTAIDEDVQKYMPLLDHFDRKDIDSFFPGLKNVIDGLHILRSRLMETARVLYLASTKEFLELDKVILGLAKEGDYEQAARTRERMDEIAALAMPLVEERISYNLPSAKIEEYVRKTPKRVQAKNAFAKVKDSFLHTDWKKKGARKAAFQLGNLSKSFSWLGGNLIKRIEEAYLPEVAAEARQLKKDLDWFKRNYREAICQEEKAIQYRAAVKDFTRLLGMDQEDLAGIRLVLQAEEVLSQPIMPPDLKYYVSLEKEIREHTQVLSYLASQKKEILRKSVSKDIRELNDLLKEEPAPYERSSSRSLQLQAGTTRIGLYKQLGIPLQDIEKQLHETLDAGKRYKVQKDMKPRFPIIFEEGLALRSLAADLSEMHLEPYAKTMKEIALGYYGHVSWPEKVAAMRERLSDFPVEVTSGELKSLEQFYSCIHTSARQGPFGQAMKADPRVRKEGEAMLYRLFSYIGERGGWELPITASCTVCT